MVEGQKQNLCPSTIFAPAALYYDSQLESDSVDLIPNDKKCKITILLPCGIIRDGPVTFQNPLATETPVDFMYHSKHRKHRGYEN